MGNVKFLFSKDDIEMKDDLIEVFGKEISISEEYELTGIGEFLTSCVIPSSALAVQIIDFILSHLVNNNKQIKQKKSADKAIKELRKVEIDGQRISMVGYSAEEIKIIASSLGLKNK